MQLHIGADGAPIYQQITEQVRQRIVCGQLRAGEELPTIRRLAELLRVNPNTVARAYRELEHEGLVEKRRTTGTFVCERPERKTAAQRRKLITPHLDRLLAHARSLGIGFEELVDLLAKHQRRFDQWEANDD